MAAVYALPTDGGPASERFRAYTKLAESRLPVGGYNPMTGKDVMATIGALLAIDAEAVAADAANDLLGLLGLDDEISLSLAVATPGLWTERLMTEVEHRLMGRFPNEVTLWIDEPAPVERVAEEARAEVVRVLWRNRHGQPRTVADAGGQEGLAAALSNSPAAGQKPDVLVADALEAYAGDTSLATKVALLYGDTAARAFGVDPIGLADRRGLEHCAAVTRRRLAEAAAGELLRTGWGPASRH